MTIELTANKNGETPHGDIQFAQSETRKVQVTVEDSDGSAVDLTSVAAKWKISEHYAEGALVEKSTSEGSITITDAVNGVLEFDLASDDTTLTPGHYRHELHLAGSGWTSIGLIGDVKVNDSHFVGD